MKLSSFTEEYLKSVNSLPSKREVIVDNGNIQRETLDKIEEQGETLNNYTNKTSAYVDFYFELKFIEDGLNGSWKPNISSDSYRHYPLIQEKIEQMLKNKL